MLVLRGILDSITFFVFELQTISDQLPLYRSPRDILNTAI